MKNYMSIQGMVTAWRAGKYELDLCDHGCQFKVWSQPGGLVSMIYVDWGELLDVTLSMVTAWRAGKYDLDCVNYWKSIQGMVTA